MRTGVIDREHLAVIGMKDRNRRIGFDPPRLTARQGPEWADFKHDVDLPVMDFVLRNTHRYVQQSAVSWSALSIRIT